MKTEVKHIENAASEINKLRGGTDIYWFYVNSWGSARSFYTMANINFANTAGKYQDDTAHHDLLHYIANLQ